MRRLKGINKVDHDINMNTNKQIWETWDKHAKEVKREKKRGKDNKLKI